ncbi:hypothetical protein NMY22_g6394 [Coprinellus aureogranulatus]|nr:hypothetical protein NMY22_g6394 [Coprinellus aureogranulatus]
MPRNLPPTSLSGLDSSNPYIAGSPASGSSGDLRQFRHPDTSLARLSASGNYPAVSSSPTGGGRVPVSYGGRSPQQPFVPYHLPSPPLSDGGSDVVSLTSINDGPPPAVIRIETDTRLPARKSLQPSQTRGGASPMASPSGSTSEHHITAPSAPIPMRRTVSSPPSSASPYDHSPADESSSPSSELTPTFPAGAVPGTYSAGTGGRWNLKLHTANPIYSQSTQSLPSSSFPPGLSEFRNQGMHSDPSLAYGEGNQDAFFTYSYPVVKQLSPIAEQEYMSPDSMNRTKSLPPSTPASGVGSEHEMRVSGPSRGGSLLTQSGSPIGSQTSEITRPSPIYSSPFISRPLNRTGSQGSSRTHVSATSSVAGPRSTKSDSHSNPSTVLPPLDLRPSFIGPHTGNGMQPSPTGSARVRTSKFSNPMPSIIGSTEGYEEDEYGGTTDRESLHAESFVTAASLDDGRPGYRRGNSAREIETVNKESAPRDGRFQVGLGLETASVRSIRSGISMQRPMPPSASESFITRRWDRDVGLAPGAPTFRAKKQWLNVTPAFWAFWFGFLCPFLWLVGGWHFTHFGEQPPRLTVWEFYFTGFCCGSKRRKEEVDHMKREGKKTAVEPPPLPRWVSEKQSSELGRARLNDPRRSLKGISFGYPFISRPKQPNPEEETLFHKVVSRMLEIMGKPNRMFDQLYGIKLREVRGRPESSRRIFDPWIQRCRYALCYAMLFLAIGLLTASAYLIVYNTRQL